jgi:hypothetical protein
MRAYTPSRLLYPCRDVKAIQKLKHPGARVTEKCSQPLRIELRMKRRHYAILFPINQSFQAHLECTRCPRAQHALGFWLRWVGQSLTIF